MCADCVTFRGTHDFAALRRLPSPSMARQPRSALPPQGIYHVTTRGVNGEAIYRDDDDRLNFLGLFALAVRRFGWDVHAFCLMGNHYHLVVETELHLLSEGMRLLNGVHAL